MKHCERLAHAGETSIGRITPAAADGTVWYTRPELHTIGRIACS